jgi:hypothetical protein
MGALVVLFEQILQIKILAKSRWLAVGFVGIRVGFVETPVGRKQSNLRRRRPTKSATAVLKLFPQLVR